MYSPEIAVDNSDLIDASALVALTFSADKRVFMDCSAAVALLYSPKIAVDNSVLIDASCPVALLYSALTLIDNDNSCPIALFFSVVIFSFMVTTKLASPPMASESSFKVSRILGALFIKPLILLSV